MQLTSVLLLSHEASGGASTASQLLYKFHFNKPFLRPHTALLPECQADYVIASKVSVLLIFLSD